MTGFTFSLVTGVVAVTHQPRTCTARSKKQKKQELSKIAKERHQIAILFYLAASCAAFFFLSLSLSLPTGESENLMWPFIQSSSVRCTQERIDFGCEVFLCFIVDSIRAPGVGAAVIGCPVL